MVERYAARARSLGRTIGLRSVDFIEVDESQARQARMRRDAEAESLLRHVSDSAVAITLNETGRSLSSDLFASHLGMWRDEGRPAAIFLIGGPDGHGEAVASRADLTLSLGAMTWPHLLARVLLAEQIYRAATILAGHPYHRA